jgi:hypothetical protein
MGRMIVAGTPYLMKFLSIAGTAAMFLVGGGILAHGIPPVHHLIEAMQQRLQQIKASAVCCLRLQEWPATLCWGSLSVLSCLLWLSLSSDSEEPLRRHVEISVRRLGLRSQSGYICRVAENPRRRHGTLLPDTP